MLTSLFIHPSTEPISAPAGQLGAFISACSQDLQTGLVDVDFDDQPRHSLLFSRGQLINVYRSGDPVERVDHQAWVHGLNNSSPRAVLHNLALTPQAVRLIKILIEQRSDAHVVYANDQALEKQFSAWLEHPIPTLAQVHWPGADALTLLPGLGVSPRYTLFISPDKILQSASSVAAIYNWKETPISTTLYSSEAPSLAWSEYLLYYSFSRLVGSLLEKFEKLAGRMVFNQVVQDVNFTASAHDWNVTFHANGVNDQAVFSSPKDANLMYVRLMENIRRQIGSVIGDDILEMLIRESVARMPMPYRAVIKEHILTSRE